MSSIRSFMPKQENKSYWSVSEIGPSPLKVHDNTDADGQVGIFKSSAATWHSGAKTATLWTLPDMLKHVCFVCYAH